MMQGRQQGNQVYLVPQPGGMRPVEGYGADTPISPNAPQVKNFHGIPRYPQNPGSFLPSQHQAMPIQNQQQQGGAHVGMLPRQINQMMTPHQQQAQQSAMSHSRQGQPG